MYLVFGRMCLVFEMRCIWYLGRAFWNWYDAVDVWDTPPRVSSHGPGGYTQLVDTLLGSQEDVLSNFFHLVLHLQHAILARRKLHKFSDIFLF